MASADPTFHKNRGMFQKELIELIKEPPRIAPYDVFGTRRASQFLPGCPASSALLAQRRLRRAISRAGARGSRTRLASCSSMVIEHRSFSDGSGRSMWRASYWAHLKWELCSRCSPLSDSWKIPPCRVSRRSRSLRAHGALDSSLPTTLLRHSGEYSSLLPARRGCSGSPAQRPMAPQELAEPSLRERAAAGIYGGTLPSWWTAEDQRQLA